MIGFGRAFDAAIVRPVASPKQGPLGKPARLKARSPIDRMAERREIKDLKPIDEAITKDGTQGDHLRTTQNRPYLSMSCCCETSRLHIHCKPGCNACCVVMVMIYRPEALASAAWLSQPENHATRDAFLAAYPAWREKVGNTPERLSQLFAAGQQASYDALQLAQWRKQTMCAFNREGSCSIYPVRPISCRNAHALDTAENCPPDAPVPPAAVSFVPLERFLKDATRILRAAHNATTARRHEQQSVCAFVHTVLAETR